MGFISSNPNFIEKTCLSLLISTFQERNSQVSIFSFTKMISQVSTFPLSHHTITLFSSISALGFATVLYLIKESSFKAIRVVIPIYIAVLILCIAVSFIISFINPLLRVNYELGYQEPETEEEGSYHIEIVSDASDEIRFISQAQFENNVALLQIFVVEVLERLIGILKEREEKREQALETLPPPIDYKSSERMLSNCVDCAICLEDFVDGDSCWVFSVADIFSIWIVLITG